MNKKKYISSGIFFFVIVLGVGIAYDIDPVPINNVLGINSPVTSGAADIDLSLPDAESSSLPAPAPASDANTMPTVPASSKKISQKTAVTALQADIPQEKGNVSSPPSPAPISVTDTPDGEDISSVSSTPSTPSTSTSFTPCVFPTSVPSTTKEIILNEVAWMGSASSSNAEWMELKNISSGEIDLSGWELLNASGKIAISFSDGDAIAPGGFFLLARGSGVTFAGAKTYPGDLKNTGDTLALIDPQCDVSDYLDASHGWPAGNNATKATMERNADGDGWHTSTIPGGTPGAENSAGPAPSSYALEIAFEGNAGGATITSDPAGLVCAASCVGSFASGTQVTLTPSAGANVVFSDWSGLCYGQTICSFMITATTSLTAEFRSTLSTSDTDTSSISTAIVGSSSDNGNSTTTPVISSSSPSSVGHILIVAVQIAGAMSDNDLVKLYNPTDAAVDMSGWKLHKRSQTGTDYSLKAFPAGSIITAAGSFMWANSGGGFSETIGANVSSTETLSADNSVALLDAAGNAIDAVAWGTGTGQYGEGPPYPTSPGANQLLSRRSSGGAMVDTDDNADDFTLQ